MSGTSQASAPTAGRTRIDYAAHQRAHRRAANSTVLLSFVPTLVCVGVTQYQSDADRTLLVPALSRYIELYELAFRKCLFDN